MANNAWVEELKKLEQEIIEKNTIKKNIKQKSAELEELEKLEEQLQEQQNKAKKSNKS